MVNGCLASLDGPLVTNSLFSQTCLITISSWALLEPSPPSRVERVETLNVPPLWGGLGGPRKASKSLIDNLGVPLDQERPPKWKNHPAEE